MGTWALRGSKAYTEIPETRPLNYIDAQRERPDEWESSSMTEVSGTLSGTRLESQTFRRTNTEPARGPITDYFPFSRGLFWLPWRKKRSSFWRAHVATWPLIMEARHFRKFLANDANPTPPPRRSCESAISNPKPGTLNPQEPTR